MAKNKQPVEETETQNAGERDEAAEVPAEKPSKKVQREVSPPSVGRIVHFGRNGQGHAALILAVHEGGTVNLKVTDPLGQDTFRSSVVHSEELAEKCWSWPPIV